MQIVSVVGARPQFIKAAVLSKEIAARGHAERLVHSGQHYDHLMSAIFFEELNMPEPADFLDVGSGSHGAQTGEMLKRLEPIVMHNRPDWLLCYGDTNTTLAAALVGAKLGIPVAHVESGLRSFNKTMPEEINRIVADHVSDLLLAPHRHAADQLSTEGVSAPVRVVGDLMIDLARIVRSTANDVALLGRFELSPRTYGVATIHRASNTDNPQTFQNLMNGLSRAGMPIVFPVHPRTKNVLSQTKVASNIMVCEPLGYVDMLGLQANARVVFTDSGGMQKEAFVLRTPCVTLREETEWIETLEDGWNVLTGADPEKIARAALRPVPATQRDFYGDGHCAKKIVDALEECLGQAQRGYSAILANAAS